MTETQYIELYDNPEDQLDAIRNIIQALDGQVLSQLGKGIVKSYKLDDGQVVIERVYGTIREITNARLYYQQEFNRIKQRIEGSITYHTPCKNKYYN